VRKARIFVFLFFLLSSCQVKNRDAAKAIGPDSVNHLKKVSMAGIAGSFSQESSLRLDSGDLDDFFGRYQIPAAFKRDIKDFYHKRHYAYAWYDVNGQLEQAGNLYNRIQNLPAEGIFTELPHLRSLDSLMEDADQQDRKIRLETELLLSTEYFYFAEKAWAGIDEQKTRELEWLLPRKKRSYSDWLESFLQMPDGSPGVSQPVIRQYNMLKRYLQKYREIDSGEKWEPLKADRKSYRLGDSAALLTAIKVRLHAFGDLKTEATGNDFDSALEVAVKNFQRRHGIREDGTIGAAMLRELNVPVQKQIEQICINMERCRWLPDTIQGNHLSINIPEFRLHLFSGDSILWDMNVVVGKSVHKTVIFSGKLKYVVFSPHWNVPASILKNEILPGVRRDHNYLAKHHMEWNGKQVRQKPGPWNSLGRVKFLFPNSFSIYLHDTPSKGLFQEDQRAFSHGCIRVAEPGKLALYLLRDEAEWTPEKVNRAMNSEKEQYVTLKQQVPVFIVYFTSWVDRQGNLNFRPDVYNRDSRLKEMIIASSGKPATNGRTP
jgi:L,D-transpeptidase YcbB